MEKLLNKWVGLFVLLITAGGIIWGGIETFDTRYVLAAVNQKVLTEIKKEIDILKLQKQYDEATTEYFSVKSLYRKYPNDEEIKEELEDAKTYRNSLKLRLLEIKK